jgi:hypothetical protein
MNAKKILLQAARKQSQKEEIKNMSEAEAKALLHSLKEEDKK